MRSSKKCSASSKSELFRNVTLGKLDWTFFFVADVNKVVILTLLAHWNDKFYHISGAFLDVNCLVNYISEISKCKIFKNSLSVAQWQNPSYNYTFSDCISENLRQFIYIFHDLFFMADFCFLPILFSFKTLRNCFGRSRRIICHKYDCLICSIYIKADECNFLEQWFTLALPTNDLQVIEQVIKIIKSNRYCCLMLLSSLEHQ